jgi:hypothetical protein
LKSHLQFRIGLVKPDKRLIVGRTIKATDHAWRTAIFGMGGSKKRIGGVKIGAIDGQPLALIAELQTEVLPGLPIWTIQGEHGIYGIAGPGAVYNDLGYGPATLGISIDRLMDLVDFDPEPEAMKEGLRRTLEARSQGNATS